MHSVHYEAGPALRLPATEVDDAHYEAGGQEDQGDDARSPGAVPVCAGRACHDKGHATASAGHPPMWTTSPSRATRRLGRPRSRSQRGAAPPWMIAAVLAALASTHEPAATLTVRQTSTAESPVAGSTMW